MARDNNLVNHEAYDSFFVTDKQKEEFENNGIGRRIPYFFICLFFCAVFGVIEYFVFGGVAGGFNLCVSAGIIAFLYATMIMPWGYTFAIASVVISAFSLVNMIMVANSGDISIGGNLAAGFAIADLSLILGGANLLMETVVRAGYNRRQKKKKTLNKNIVKMRKGLVIIAAVDCLTGLATTVIGIVLSFDTIS